MKKILIFIAMILLASFCWAGQKREIIGNTLKIEYVCDWCGQEEIFTFDKNVSEEKINNETGRWNQMMLDFKDYYFCYGKFCWVKFKNDFLEKKSRE